MNWGEDDRDGNGNNSGKGAKPADAIVCTDTYDMSANYLH